MAKISTKTSMKIVSFTGAQNTGKSTLLSECHKRISIGRGEFIPEVTRKVKREYGVVINEGSGLDCQYLIAAEHLQNALRRCPFAIAADQENGNKTGITELRVLDRCAIDGYIYAQYLAKQYDDKPAEHSWFKLVNHSRNVLNMVQGKYDLIFYTEPEDIEIVDDGERSIDVEFRNGIIKLYEQYIKDALPSVYDKIVRLKGTVEERMETIIERLTGIGVKCFEK
jgi:nicotinamide riboside kinase